MNEGEYQRRVEVSKRLESQLEELREEVTKFPERIKAFTDTRNGADWWIGIAEDYEHDWVIGTDPRYVCNTLRVTYPGKQMFAIRLFPK